jgi:3-hydroxymyristoyl/3-hydroxydecanoyl-(acyl carrier protein) dehydratases
LRKIKSEIREYMEPGNAEAALWEASFLFPPEFIAFQGHFPGRAILPGACQVQCLLTMLEEFTGKPLALKEIVLAKYITPVLPDEAIKVRLVEPLLPDFSGTTVKAVILHEETRVSEIRIRVTIREKEER